MSKWRILGRILGVAVISAGLLYLWVDYSLRRSFRLALGPQFGADVEDMIVATKGLMFEFYFDQKSYLSALANAKAHSDKTNQVLAAYRSDPEKYKKYAKLADTILNASHVGDELLKTRSPAQLPRTSDELSSMRQDLRRDAWGHPFCIVSSDKLILVVSLGPEAHSPFSCQRLHLNNDLGKSERKIFQTPSGELVLKIDRGTTTPSLSQALSVVPSTPD